MSDCGDDTVTRYRIVWRSSEATVYYRAGEGHGWHLDANQATLYIEQGFADRDRASMSRLVRAESRVEAVKLPLLQPADEWLKDPKYKGLVVLDPDGWDRQNFKASWAEKITRGEFERRVVVSTCRWPVSLILESRS